MSTTSSFTDVKKEHGSSQGVVYTFYSYKGGVGRSMALANIGCLLARWGRKVLLVDFDIEAPGIERFFGPKAVEERKNLPGVIDLIHSYRTEKPIDWHDCLIDVSDEYADTGGRLSILTAGRLDNSYMERAQSLNWNSLFSEHNVGDRLWDLRNEWTTPGQKDSFDFVLIDSRTGITDIGGICTTLLPDDLVLLFTTTEQSYLGVIDVARRAIAARRKIPRDLALLRCVPVPTREEAQSEWHKNREWHQVFSKAFSDLYSTWLPVGVEATDVLNKLYVPYVPVWSFGEKLPVHEAPDEIQKPGSIGASYGRLAKFLDSHLEWGKLSADMTAYELEEERQFQRENIEEGKRQLRAQTKRLRIVSYILVSMALLYMLLAFLWYSSNREQQLKFKSQNLIDALAVIPPEQGGALVSEEIRGLPAPDDWRVRLEKLWRELKAEFTKKKVSDKPILDVLILDQNDSLVWYTESEIKWEKIEGGTIRNISLGENLPASVSAVPTGDRLVVTYDSGHFDIFGRTSSEDSPTRELGKLNQWIAAKKKPFIGFIVEAVEDAEGQAEKAKGEVWKAEDEIEDTDKERIDEHILEPSESSATGDDESESEKVQQAFLLDPKSWDQPFRIDCAKPVKIAFSPNGELSGCEQDDDIVVVNKYDAQNGWTKVVSLEGRIISIGNWGIIVKKNNKFAAWKNQNEAGTVVEIEPVVRFENAALNDKNELIGWTSDLKFYNLQREGESLIVKKNKFGLIPNPTVSASGLAIQNNRVVNIWTKEIVIDELADSAAISANGSGVVIKENGTHSLMWVETNKPLERVRLNFPENPYNFVLNGSGDWVAAAYWGSNRGVYLLNRKTNTVYRWLSERDANELSISDDGTRMVVETDGGIHYLVYENGKLQSRASKKGSTSVPNRNRLMATRWSHNNPTVYYKRSSDTGDAEYFEWRPGDSSREVTKEIVPHIEAGVSDWEGNRSFTVNRGTVEINWSDGHVSKFGGQTQSIAAAENFPRILLMVNDDLANTVKPDSRHLLYEVQGDSFSKLNEFDDDEIEASPNLDLILGRNKASGKINLYWTADTSKSDQIYVSEFEGIHFDSTGKYCLILSKLGNRLYNVDSTNRNLREIKTEFLEECDNAQFEDSAAIIDCGRVLGNVSACAAAVNRAVTDIKNGREVDVSSVERCEQYQNSSNCTTAVNFLKRNTGSTVAVLEGLKERVVSDLQKCLPQKSSDSSAEEEYDASSEYSTKMFNIQTKEILHVMQKGVFRKRWQNGRYVATQSRYDSFELWRMEPKKVMPLIWEDALEDIASRTTECLEPEYRMALLQENEKTATQKFDECQSKNDNKNN